VTLVMTIGRGSWTAWSFILETDLDIYFLLARMGRCVVDWFRCAFPSIQNTS